MKRKITVCEAAECNTKMICQCPVVLKLCFETSKNSAIKGGGWGGDAKSILYVPKDHNQQYSADMVVSIQESKKFSSGTKWVRLTKHV